MLKKSIIWLLALFFSLFLLEKAYKFALKENLNIKASYVLKKKINADVLILGSCEAMSMVSPDVIDSVSNLSAYNLATNHASISEQYLHLYLYLRNNKAPEVLLMHIGGENLDSRFNIFNGYRFVHLMDDSIVYQTIREKDSIYIRLNNFPFLKYAYYNDFFTFRAMQGFKHFTNKKATPYNSKGFEYYNIDIDEEIKKINTNYPQGIFYQWDKSEEQYLYKIIDLAKANNIRLIIYQSPVWEGAYTYLKNKKEMDARIEKIATENSIEYILFDIPEISAYKSNYITLLRLNKKNALVFSAILAKYVKQEVSGSKYQDTSL
jgi:hypothetical protein